MARLPETASQTAGPFLHIGLAPHAAGIEGGLPALGLDVAGDAPGPRIAVAGRILDGLGAPVGDALIEVWQADAEGRRPNPGVGFRGWGRAATDPATGAWRVETVRPGPVAGRDGRPQAPHLSLWIVARGINIGLHTRIYFADADEANAADPLLRLVEPARRGTLIARPDGPGAWRHDIVLQGAGETVFLDV